MFSIPPARMTCAPPMTISWAAEMMACRPEPQTRLSVMAGTLLGRPAFRASCRPGFMPWPACNTLPTITWSTCPGSNCASSNTLLATVAPRSAAGISLSMPPKVPMAVLRGVEMTISWIVFMTCSFRACQLNCNGRGLASEIAVQVRSPLNFYLQVFSISSSFKRIPDLALLSLRLHDEIRMVLHLCLDLYARLAADPPSLVDTAITQHTSLCWLAQVLHREGRRGSGQPGVCCIGRHRKDLLFLIVDGLRDPQSREINAGDGRLVELAQVRLVKDPPPCLLATGLSRHDDGIGLSTRIRLGESKAVIELSMLSVPRRLTELLGQDLQVLVAGSVPHFA